MSLHSRWEQGNLVFYDGATRVMTIPGAVVMSNPLLIPNVIRPGMEYAVDFFDHFTRFSEDEWTVIKTDVGVDGAQVNALANAHGGVLQLSTNDADEDEAGVRTDAEFVLPSLTALKSCWFLSRFSLDDADKAECNIGLMISDTKIGQHHAAGGGVTDGIYLRSPHNAALLYGETCKDSAITQTAALATLEDGVMVWAGFFFDAVAGTVQFQANGVDVGAAIALTIPNDEELGVTLAVQTGHAFVRKMLVDAVRVIALI